MKRVLLLVATNVAVMLVLSVVVSILGVDRWLLANGINYGALLWLSAIFGFGGAFISLLISKWLAKMSVGAQTIDGSEGTTEFWLVQTVHKLADAAGIGVSSLYNAFGSKHELFLRVLHRYTTNELAHLIRLLAEPGPVRDRIQRLLEAVAGGSARTGAAGSP